MYSMYVDNENTDSTLQSYFVDCRCSCEEHILRFDIDFFPDDPILATSVFLNVHLPWYKRLWIAFKYVFGYVVRKKDGHFDCTIFEEKDVENLKQLCDRYLDVVYNEKEEIKLLLSGNKKHDEQAEFLLNNLVNIEMQKIHNMEVPADISKLPAVQRADDNIYSGIDSIKSFIEKKKSEKRS